MSATLASFQNVFSDNVSIVNSSNISSGEILSDHGTGVGGGGVGGGGGGGSHPAAQVLLVAMNGATLLALCCYAAAVYAKTEVSHPVFAVILQDVLALCAFSAASYLSLLTTAVDYYEHVAPLVMQMVALQFHQWSWLVVTLLRHVIFPQVVKKLGSPSFSFTKY